MTMGMVPSLIGLGGSLLGGLLGPKQSQQEKDLMAAQTANAQQGSQMASWAQGQAQNMLPQSLDMMNKGMGTLDQSLKDLDPIQRFYQQLASGNRGEMMGAMEPQISQMQQGYGNQMKTGSELNPRGGARASTMAEMPYQQMGLIQQLMNAARQQGFQGLQSLAGQQAQIGSQQAGIGQGLMGGATSLFGSGTSALSGANQANQGLLNYGMTNRAQMFNQGSDLGKSLGGALQDMAWESGKFGTRPPKPR
jgi:hypothetical protein